MSSSSAESESPELSALFERLLSRHRNEFSLFVPLILGLTTSTRPETQEDGESRGTPNPNPADSVSRMILINPFTQGTVVIDGGEPAGFESLMRDLFSSGEGGGRPPASKASIEGLKTVESGDCLGEECVICLEEFAPEGKAVKEMPCKHRFHGGCVEKWLKVHGSCPVCRFEMPVEEAADAGKREVWVSFAVGGRRRSSASNNSDSSAGNPNSNPSSNSNSGSSSEDAGDSIRGGYDDIDE